MAAKHNISLDDLIDGPLMESARKRARIRLVDTVQSKEGVELSGGDIHTEEGRLIEAFSFYYARLVICASEDERLLARWAQAEAARAEHLLNLRCRFVFKRDTGPHLWEGGGVLRGQN